MDGLENKEVTIIGKDNNTLPEGAKVTKKRVDITVEQIENGYILKKNYDIQYTLDGKQDYLYYCKKVYSEDNPIEIKEDKMLADYFD